MHVDAIPVAELYRAYWSAWEQFLLQEGSPLPEEAQSHDYWWKFEVGRRGVHIAAVIKLETRPPRDVVGTRVELCLRTDLLGRGEAKLLHDKLRDHKEEWERSLDAKLDWESQAPPGKQFQVAVDIPCDPRDQSDWPRQHRMLLDWIRRFRLHFDTTQN